MAEKSTSTHVTVACKIGVPWIDFEVCEPHEIDENTQTGPRKITQWMRTGEKVRIRGTAYPRGEAPEGFPERPQFVMGYALTHGVDRAVWEKIVEQQKRAPYFVSGMIYAFERIEDIRSATKDHEKEMSGLEPVARAKIDGADTIIDARMPRSMNQNISNVVPGSRAA
jgi:hypothetical protein